MPENHMRSPCPIANTLDLLGDKWTLLVVRDLFLGRQHFKEFAASPERISTNILSERLSRLVESGLVERFPSPEQSARDAYRLTQKGMTLKPVLEAVKNWGLKNIEGTQARLTPK